MQPGQATGSQHSLKHRTLSYWAIVPAAGASRRFGDGVRKQYARLEDRTLIEWALAPFLGDVRCRGIVVAIAADDDEWQRLPALPAKVVTTTGGAERSDSVRRALAALEGRAAEDDWILVHDAARPCLDSGDLDRLLAELADHPVGGLLATPVADTLKRLVEPEKSSTTIERSGLWRALTPQMFRYGRLRAALDAAAASGRMPTDEAQVIEWHGGAPALVPGSPANIKVTTPEDLDLAAMWLARRNAGAASARIGFGFDVHAFGPGDAVMLAGVRVPHSRGVVAHSDGDVVLHALCDALLGAAGLGDIGEHFRDDDPRWRGADSAGFVTAVRSMLGEQSLEVVNVDVTIIAQAPRIGPWRAAMRARLAELTGAPLEAVNVKATTTEGLGFTGRGEGIAAQAITLLRRV